MTYRISKLLEKGKFNWKGLKNILHNHESRLDALEQGDGSSTSYDDTEVKADITALENAIGDNSSGLTKSVNDLETAIGDETDATSILGRIKALEDAQDPQTPDNP